MGLQTLPRRGQDRAAGPVGTDSRTHAGQEVKAEGEGIREILESGTFCSIYHFRNPQCFSAWRSSKATKRQMDAYERRHGHPMRSRGVLTSASKDEKPPWYVQEKREGKS